MKLSVVVPAHNPNPDRLHRTLAGLRAQTLPASLWETVLVDNASQPPLDLDSLAAHGPANLSLVRENRLGLSEARRRGFADASGECLVLVDDDNVLAPDYLAVSLAHLAAHPRVGALGGKALPEFTVPAPAWTREFHPLLAIRDLGATPIISDGLRPRGSGLAQYPACAPIGAGMVLRRAAVEAWIRGLAMDPRRITLDRRGSELVSGGDNDLVLAAMEDGWEVGYFPDLRLVHLIPEGRLSACYLARLNRALQRSWVQVLAIHDACPWPPLSATGAELRKFRAWFVERPWFSDAARVRYAGICGHYDGRTRT